MSSNPKTVSVVSKMQFTRASRSSHRWLSKQPQLVQSSKLVVASLSYAELGTAQPQLVFIIIKSNNIMIFQFDVYNTIATAGNSSICQRILGGHFR